MKDAAKRDAMTSSTLVKVIPAFKMLAEDLELELEDDLEDDLDELADPDADEDPEPEPALASALEQDDAEVADFNEAEPENAQSEDAAPDFL